MSKAAKVRPPRKTAHVPKYQSLMKLFVLEEPEKVKGRDGKMYTIFHRYGASGGAYSKREFMQKEGMMSELSDVEKDANKRYKDPGQVREIVSSRAVYLKKTLNSRLSAMKMALNREYQPDLIPLAVSTRIHSETEERKFFIQGWANRDGEFVVGNRDDAALWAIEVMGSAHAMARKYRLAHKVGEKLIEKGLLSSSVKERLALTLRS